MTQKARGKYAVHGPESESEPGSRGRVLRNRLGITSKREMDAAEANALHSVQVNYTRSVKPGTRFTAALIQVMHADWLREIYDWAGTYRSVNIQKEGFVWPPAHLIPKLMREFEETVLREHTPCRPDSLAVVAGRMAAVHAELLLVHPFREGNGRLARWLAGLMALLNC